MRTAGGVAVGWALAMLPAAGCVSIPSGYLGVLVGPGGVAPEPLGEGDRVVGPFSRIETYDLRAEQKTEDIVALSEDGQPLEARASVLTFRPVPGELVALAREVGPDYYRVLIQPIVRSAARRILARVRADQLDTPGILRAQAEITREATDQLRAHHITLEGVDIRALGILRSSAAYRAVIETGVAEQKALAAPQLLELERRRAAERRASGAGVAEAHALLAPTLAPQVLAAAATRAWTTLLTAPTSSVEIHSPASPLLMEVQP